MPVAGEGGAHCGHRIRPWRAFLCSSALGMGQGPAARSSPWALERTKAPARRSVRKELAKVPMEGTSSWRVCKGPCQCVKALVFFLKGLAGVAGGWLFGDTKGPCSNASQPNSICPLPPLHKLPFRFQRGRPPPLLPPICPPPRIFSGSAPESVWQCHQIFCGVHLRSGRGTGTQRQRSAHEW